MKNFILGALALFATSVAMAQGSDIPPKVDVVTSCGKVVSVHLTDSGKTTKYDSTNTAQPILNSMADGAPHGMWIDAGCQR
jgi:hypothetical protein